MRILAVAPQPFYSSRGTPLSVYYRTLLLAEQGAEVDVLTYGAGKDVDIPGVRVLRIPRLRWFEPIPVGPSWQKAWLDVLLAIWTIGALIRNRYQAVDAHEEAVFWCRFLKPLFRFRLIYDMHSSLPQQLRNFEFTTSKLLIGTFRWLERSCLRAADAVITVCPDLHDYALRVGVPPQRLLLIENSLFDAVQLRRSDGADPDTAIQQLWQFAPEHPVILYAGTLEVYQGVEMLVDAFARVVAARPEVRLLIVGGSDAQVQKLRAQADSLGLGERCVVAGHLPRSQALLLAASAAILVSPRVYGTNTPLKIYEQLASGRPMVATRILSHTQVLDDSVCRLVEPTPEALADGLLATLAEPEEAARRTRNAAELFERQYSRPVYTGNIRRLLEIIS